MIDMEWNKNSKAGNLEDVAGKIQVVSSTLTSWSKQKFKRVDFHIRELKAKIANIKNQPLGEDSVLKIK